MSLSSALSAALSGIQANQRQIQLVSNNVSNASVPGYTKKSAALETNLVGLGVNGGVNVAQIKRDVDEFLVDQVRRQESAVGFDSTKAEFFKRVQDFFGTLGSDTTLSNTINDLKTSLEELAIEPENSAMQAEVVERAKEVAQQFRDFTRQTQELRTEADNQIDISVTRINNNLQEVRELNAKILTAKGKSQPTAELEDQRDQALKALSEQMDINTFKRSSGEVVVLGDKGNILVDTGFNETLSFAPAGQLGSGVDGGSVTTSTGATISGDVGGRLGALLQLRDTDLPNFQADLDRLAAQVRDQVNEAHNMGQLNNKPVTVSGGSDDLTGAHVFNNAASPNITALSGSLEFVAVDAAGNVDGSVGNNGVVSVDLDNVQTTVSGGAGFPIALDDGTANDLISQLNAEIAGNGGSATTFALNNGQLTINDPFGSGEDFVIRSDPSNPPRINSTAINSVDRDTQTSAPGFGTPDRNFSHFFGLNNLLETPDEPQGISGSNPDMIVGNMAMTTNGVESVDTGPGVSAASALRVREDIAENPGRISRMLPRNEAGEAALPAGEPTVVQQMAAAFDDPVAFSDPSDLGTTVQASTQTAVADPDALLTAAGVSAGAQTLTIQTSGANVNVAYDAGADSLNDLRDRIDATGSLNARVVASGSGSVLEITSQTGEQITGFADTGDLDTNLSFSAGSNTSGDPRGNISSRTVTLSGFAGDILQFQAGETARLDESATFKTSIRDELEFRADSQSGVNIDEELARLTQFQQAFNANARVIATVDELFSTLEAMLN